MATHARDVLAERRRRPPGFNERAGDALTTLLGSMWFFWFCVGLDTFAFIGLLLATAATYRGGGIFAVALLWVVFVSQTVIQLLALPVLQHAGNRSQKHSEAVAEATYRNSAAAETEHAALAEAVARMEAKLEGRAPDRS